MGRVWLVCCTDSWYGLVKRKIDAFGEGGQIVRVPSAEDLSRFGVDCEEGTVRMVLVATKEALEVVCANVIQVRRDANGCRVVVMVAGCDMRDVAHLLHAGVDEVIAVDEGESLSGTPENPIALEACKENDTCDDAWDSHVAGRDDLVPLDELWPPLDEPDETGVMGSVDDVAGIDGRRWKDEHIEEGDAVEGREPEKSERSLRAVADAARSRSTAVGGRYAPLVTLVSGRGGVGKTTVAASLAVCAARAGLRAAVIDLDLMHGDMPAVLGAQAPKGLEQLVAHERDGVIAEEDIEAAAVRVGPGLTLWGPLERGERAELFGGAVEQLILALRNEADVIFADTSCSWGDAVAVAVGACDRCLLLGSAGETSGDSAARVVGLAARMGVPAARMTSVFNRLGAKGCGEAEALRFEMGASLRSRARIKDGGELTAQMVSFGKLETLIGGDSEFAQSVRSFGYELLSEIGCHVDDRFLKADARTESPKLALPWRRKKGADR